MEVKLDNNIYKPIPPLLRGGKGVCNQGVTISKTNPPPNPLLIEGEQIIDYCLINIIAVQYYFHYSSDIILNRGCTIFIYLLVINSSIKEIIEFFSIFHLFGFILFIKGIFR
jgi:hypothetical protein